MFWPILNRGAEESEATANASARGGKDPTDCALQSQPSKTLLVGVGSDRASSGEVDGTRLAAESSGARRLILKLTYPRELREDSRVAAFPTVH